MPHFLTLVFWGTFLHLLDSEAVKIDIRVGRLKPGLLHSGQVVNDHVFKTQKMQKLLSNNSNYYIAWLQNSHSQG